MAEFLLGMEAKAYFGSSGGELSGLTELTNVKDVTINNEAGKADFTTRANQGWRATAPTLRELTVEFQMVWKPGDAGFEAIKTAYLTSATLCLAFLDGDKAAPGSQGPMGDFSITSFTREEPLEEAIMVSVTANLAVWDQWVGSTP